MTQELPADGRALPDCREPSDAVRAAQERLFALRRQHGIDTRGRNELRVTSDELRVQKEDRPSPVVLSSSLPSFPIIQDTCEETSLTSSLVTRHSSLVRVYPDLALGILRRKKAAPGRVWLLMRHHDARGRGRVPADEATRLLTGEGSPLRVCGRRQLANLLAAGEGLFWDRAPGRNGEEQIWLRSTARVAAALGIRRLGGSPVALPLPALTGGIGDFRAHLYASFHSGRQRAGLLSGRPRPRGPIARGTLCKLSGAAPNSQRNYERRARVGRQSTFAVGPQLTAADEQEVAWRRGRALFRLRDAEGRYGRPGGVYLAWQLPNEYTGPHATLPRGRQKRLNRALADLFHDGMTGNGEPELRVTSDELRVTSQEARPAVRKQYPVSGEQSSAGPRPSSAKRFYSSARVAFLARGDHERYWRCAGAWLWQGELRVTSDELRVRKEALQSMVTSITDFFSPANSDHPPSTAISGVNTFLNS